MHPTVLLLNLAAAVMLLLWAVRMVRTGVERAYGTSLKKALRETTGSHVTAAGAGCILAVFLQSSTAVGVLAAGFAASGILPLPAGIATLIGADLGSALVVQILSIDLSALVPVLLLVGATMFLKFEGRQIRQIGRILLGIAFILIALQMIASSTEPLRHSEILPQITGYLSNDPITSFAVAALATWLFHSSVAAVLLLVSFAQQGLLPLEVALPMVLGANAGGGIIAVWLTRGLGLEARRITLGNLLFRGTFALLALAAIQLFPLPMEYLGGTEARQLVNAHLAFNVVLVAVSLPLAGLMARLTTAVLGGAGGDEMTGLAGPASALDRSVIDVPSLALASATRELLRMGETVERMFRPVMDLFDHGASDRIAMVRKLDREVNRAHTEIKLFLAEVNRGELSEEEARRGVELTDFAINLEHVGDIIAKTLMPLAEEKMARRLRFSPAGWSEMNALHARVTSNLQLALNVLISGDLDSARQLVKEKEQMRRLERSSHERHLRRLQSGEVSSIETSNMHLEIVRALKEINSLLATVAYPILSGSGGLLESRLA
ncbi:Na/Pi cotransporter family protein [Oricola cellulosilytica]|uniref:Na/Pi cotransporter family protein n=1 Tax=Oricola cellulosilytica TaxID=1429082 RepID=A0A4R0PBW5_9HYPH|nr:Na/Pi cotransporter family protein [Oricola cellulosilytica]TCD13837.1 Na/Pi cotransporter family protein [Oricola cellulosilytica]